MPRSDGRGGPLCTDCYFSREMLCALKRVEGCKTFRPVQGRQAQSVQVPTPTMEQLEMAVSERPAAIVEQPAKVVPITRPVEKAEPKVEAPTLSTNQTPLRSAAATRSVATTCVIDVRSRVAARVAERYPKALQLC